MPGPIRRILLGPVAQPPPLSMEEVRRRIRMVTDEKKAQWRKEGFDEKRIFKAIKWAQNWTDGVAVQVTQDEDLRERIRLDMMPKALDQADNWLRGMKEGVEGDEYRKAYERIGVKVKAERVKTWEDLGKDEC